MKKFPIYLLILSTSLWFSPMGNTLEEFDILVFKTLNSSLTNYIWQSVWAILNHSYESTINVFVMVGINFYLISQAPKLSRKKYWYFCLYYWACFQLVLLAEHFIFRDLLQISRLSPSIALDYNKIVLSDIFNFKIKESSGVCFPAGHALVAGYWAAFSLKMSRNYTANAAIIIIAFVLCISRLFTGAHWASDVIFSVTLGVVWFQIFNYIRKLTKLTLSEPRYI